MIRVILADDHVLVRISVRTILEKRGDVEVHEASDGAEAVAKALRLKPDVVILDLNMPVMSGYQAAAELRRLLPGIPILFFSTQSQTQLAADARASGVQGFVNKADANTALLQAVDDVVVNKGTFFPDSSKKRGAHAIVLRYMEQLYSRITTVSASLPVGLG